MTSSTLKSTLQERINHAAANSSQGGVLVVNILNIHNIMEVYGSETTSNVLSTLQERLVTALGSNAQIFHENAEFFHVIFDHTTPEELEKTAFDINIHIRQFCCDNHFDTSGFVLVPSLGSVLFPTHGTEAQDILDKAYISVKHTAHESEKLYYPYEKTLNHCDDLKRELTYAHTLQCALLDNRLHLAYQPIIDANTGNTVHYEALLRLVNHQGQVVSAGPYIPVSEKLGLIDTVDETVLDMVMHEMKESNQASLSFNISSLGIDNPRWFESLSKTLKSHPDIAPRLMIEITETAAQRDIGRTAYFVAQIQDMGCKVALDDFGAGNTSIRQLKSLSIDVVKIDGSLIRHISKNADNQIFVQMLVDIAEKFSLRTIAECVENGETARTLMDMGVHCFQGMYFGSPVIHRPWFGSEPYQYDESFSS